MSMKNAQSSWRRDVVAAISLISGILAIYVLATCYGEGLLILPLKSDTGNVPHLEIFQSRNDGLDQVLYKKHAVVDLVARDDNNEDDDDLNSTSNDDSNTSNDDSNAPNDDSSSSDLTASSSSKSESFVSDLLSKTWFRIVLALLGIIVLHMTCVCLHHVYHVLSRGTKPYGKLEYNQSPF